MLKNLTRESVANLAGISLSSLRNLEKGTGSSLKTLLAVIGVLNKESWVKSLAPEISVNPLHMVKGKPRQRAPRITKEKKNLAHKEHGLKKYGLTIDQYIQMHKLQDGKCGNTQCGTKLDLNSSTTHVDHDHKTGKVRSLLCNNCNCALGMINDNQNKLLGLIDYLKNHF